MASTCFLMMAISSSLVVDHGAFPANDADVIQCWAPVIALEQREELGISLWSFLLGPRRSWIHAAAASSASAEVVDHSFDYWRLLRTDLSPLLRQVQSRPSRSLLALVHHIGWRMHVNDRPIPTPNPPDPVSQGPTLGWPDLTTNWGRPSKTSHTRGDICRQARLIHGDEIWGSPAADPDRRQASPSSIVGTRRDLTRHQRAARESSSGLRQYQPQTAFRYYFRERSSMAWRN